MRPAVAGGSRDTMCFTAGRVAGVRRTPLSSYGVLRTKEAKLRRGKSKRPAPIDLGSRRSAHWRASEGRCCACSENRNSKDGPWAPAHQAREPCWLHARLHATAKRRAGGDAAAAPRGPGYLGRYLVARRALGAAARTAAPRSTLQARGRAGPLTPDPWRGLRRPGRQGC